MAVATQSRAKQQAQVAQDDEGGAGMILVILILALFFSLDMRAGGAIRAEEVQE